MIYQKKIYLIFKDPRDCEENIGKEENQLQVHPLAQTSRWLFLSSQRHCSLQQCFAFFLKKRFRLLFFSIYSLMSLLILILCFRSQV